MMTTWICFFMFASPASFQLRRHAFTLPGMA
jgi:hypothetical protein